MVYLCRILLQQKWHTPEWHVSPNSFVDVPIP